VSLGEPEPHIRHCPGERYEISEAICRARQKHGYVKCPECPFAEGNSYQPAVQTVKPEGEKPTLNLKERLDLLFKNDDVAAPTTDVIDAEIAWRIGYAFRETMRSMLTGYSKGDATANSIMVARDNRPSSSALARELIEGILANGGNVIDIGVADTPQVYFGVRKLGFCGGVSVTGSHFPPEYNGFKFCGPDAAAVGRDTGLADIRRLAQTSRLESHVGQGRLIHRDLDLYIQHVRSFLNLAHPVTVVIDAHDGVSSQVVPRIFTNSNMRFSMLNDKPEDAAEHNPDPDAPDALRRVADAVPAESANFGMAFDSDMTRCGVVDNLGRKVSTAQVAILFAAHILHDNPGGIVVRDRRMPPAFGSAIKKLSGTCREASPTDYAVYKTMNESKALMGVLQEGEFYFRDNFNRYSGIVTLALLASILSRQQKSLSELAERAGQLMQRSE
jgi:phosphomannomutase